MPILNLIDGTGARDPRAEAAVAAVITDHAGDDGLLTDAAENAAEPNFEYTNGRPLI